MRALKVFIPALLTLATGASLFGEQPQWGVQGGLSVPSADLSDSANLGLTGGGNGKWNLGRGHAVIGRADLALYGRKNGNSDSSVAVAGDYTYHLSRNQQGLYFLGGVSVMDYSWSRQDNSRSDTALGLDLGVGYDLDRNVGLQARYTTHSVSGGTLDALNLGVTYTFPR